MPKTPYLSGPFARRANHFRYSEISSSEKSIELENISLYRKCKSVYTNAIPSRTEGRIMIVATRDGDAVDADVALDGRSLRRTAKACGPGARNGVKSLERPKADQG